MTSFPTAAVLGDPIGHSKSPRIHRYWLDKYSISGEYTRLQIAPDNLARALDALPDLGFVGANVTIPHKVAVMDLADEILPNAQAIGAANTLYFEGGKIIADNTDGYGFIANLDQNAPNWDKTRPALVLGAGGAARAIVYGLIQAGLPQVIIANRTLSKAQALADELGATAIDWSDIEDTLADVGVLVNTTSLGMSGQPELDLDLTTLPFDALVTDIVYAPLITPLLARAKSRGNTIVDGLGMLLHQAVPGFARWFGTTPQVDEFLRHEVLK